MTWTPEELEQIDCAYWANLRKIKLQVGVFSFKDHEYLLEPMQGAIGPGSRRVCCIKGTQGGWTTKETLNSLHGMIYKRYLLGVLYTFPTNDDVREFSQSRFNSLISANREAIGKYVKTGGKGTDTTSLKKIHDAWLFLRGARLSQKIGDGIGEKESGKMRSISVDRVVFDEMDLMDEGVIQKALGRMGASRVKEESYLSNPTLPDVGIDAMFKKSDQRYFFNICDSCGEYTCAVKEFPECVKLREDGTGYIVCKKCGKEIIQRSKGEWVPAECSNTPIMHGYQWSQLNSMTNDPGEILSQYNDPPQGNLGDIYRLRLGLPYVATEDKLSEGLVYSCCNQEVMPSGHTGPCAMGVDVGKVKHVIIGIRTDRENYRILKVAQLSRWEDIHDIAQRFNVKSAVIDIRPYEDEARRFQLAENYRIFLCEYTDNPMHDALWNKDKTVKVYRTGVFDRTHALVTQKLLQIPRKCPEIETFARQVCGTAKVLELNKRTNTSVYRYRPVGSQGDHYRNALNYFWLAAAGGKIARVGPKRRRQTMANNNYVQI